MGTECIVTTLSEDPDLSFPPGFGPFAALTLQGIQRDVKPADAQPSSAQVIQTVEKDIEILEKSSAHCRNDTPCSTSGSFTCRKSLRNRPTIDYSLFELLSDDDSDVEAAGKGETSVRRRRQLPKGVVRGCAQCADCQKVVARWNPSGARRPLLDEAPVFYPSEEEFKDTLKYIESIRSTAEPYGICRIVPPPSWKPPCLLKEKNIWECSKFSTRVQKIDELQNRKSSKKSSKGGMMKKRRKISEPKENSNINQNQAGMQQNQERFGFEPGPEFTLQTFKKYADDFSNQYFKNDACENSHPSVEDIEGEYWRIVERPTEEIEVIYGADLETGTFGSGFPKSSSEVKPDTELKYAQSGWNLNNLPRLQGSVLSFEGGDISGVLVPWVYVGMCFSSFCWHVEDHHLYSLNYMHWGAPKMWYGVPGKDAVNLETAMRKHLPDLFEEQPDLLHNLVTQFSPSLLKLEGVPVYRCVQHEGEFVLTFPRAYHAGFNCGFNCAEAVNVAPVDWLPIGQDAVELYREQGRKITISHDKLLLGAAREAIRAQWDILFLKRNTADNLRWKNICGPDSTIYKSLKARIEMELKQRHDICSPSQSRKMDTEFDSADRECAFCYYDLHLSASGCSCCPEKYTCLAHAKQLCSCNLDKRSFLFRYDVSELNILADALGGKLSAIHRWGVSDLGLSLSSCVKREKVPGSTIARRSTDGPRRSYMTQTSTVSLVTSSVCNEQKNNGNEMMNSGSPAQNNVCSSVEQTKTGISPLKVPLEKNEVSCSQTNGTSQFPTAPFSTSGGSMKSVHGLVLGEHHNKRPILVDHGTHTKPNGNGTQLHKDQELISPEKNKSQACTSSVQQCAKSVPKVQSASQEAPASVFASKPHVNPSLSKNACGGLSSGGGHLGHPNVGSQQPNGLQTRSESPSGVEDRVTGHSAVLLHPTLENHNRNGGAQKGPRIANVVHRFKCSVEPLEIGYVLSGKLWCSSQAIFPKGFRSRVKYFSIVDPTLMAYYVSEILDAGPHGPMFMVTLENCPGEIFINVSPTKCWNMVRERLNMEIRRQLGTGRANLPTLQPPGSVDGLEMFGFLSPAIVQAIEVRDRYHICTEYWSVRPHDVVEDRDSWCVPPQVPPHIALRGLFQRASRDELQALRSLLMNTSSLDDSTRHQAAQALDAEIGKGWCRGA